MQLSRYLPQDTHAHTVGNEHLKLCHMFTSYSCAHHLMYLTPDARDLLSILNITVPLSRPLLYTLADRNVWVCRTYSSDQNEVYVA